MKRSPPPTIAITYAWGNDCTGDMAIVLGLVRLLEQALPEVRPVVFTVESEDDHEQKKTERYLRSLKPGLEIHPDPFSPLVAGSSSEKRAWNFQAQLTSRHPVPPTSGRASAAMKAWLGADLRLFNSSMKFTHRRDGSQLRFWLPNALARRLSLPYALWGQSFGAIDYPGLDMIKHFLGDAALLTNRDQYSQKLVSSLNLTKPILGYTPDPVLFFDYSDQKWADRFLHEHQLERGRFLTVLPRTYEFWGEKTPVSLLESRMTKLAHAIDQWVDKTGQKVLLTYELPREVARMRTLLLPKLSVHTRRNQVLFARPWTAEQALAVFQRSSALLCMERYSVFLGLSAGTPVLHPTSNAISLRMDALDEMKLGKYHVRIDDCSKTELSRRLLSLHDDREKIVERVGEGRNQLARESIRMMRKLWRRVRK